MLVCGSAAGDLDAGSPGAAKKRPAPSTPPATPAEPVTFPLETLRIQGNRRIPAQKILSVAGLKTGAIVVKPDFDDARPRLPK